MLQAGTGARNNSVAREAEGALAGPAGRGQGGGERAAPGSRWYAQPPGVGVAEGNACRPGVAEGNAFAYPGRYPERTIYALVS